AQSPGTAADGTPAKPAEAASPGQPDGQEADGRPFVRGRVLRADGTPVSGGTVTVVDPSGRQAGRAVAGQGGSFRVALPGRGTYTVIAIAPGQQPQAAAVLVGDQGADRDLLLPGTSRLSGNIREARAGTPLAGAAVSLAGQAGEVIASQQADAAGRYEFGGLAAGSYTLAVSALSCHPVALPVSVPDGRSVSLDAELPRGSQLAGTARTAEGEPVPHARVTLLDPAGNVTGASTTGRDGQFAFENLPAGDYTVIASGYPPVAHSLRISPGQDHSGDIELGHPRG
ncbi:MAG TPA: carboxypeptidase-like regulatory domain-containing protein, partial [Streptosporangiaceae bacterium]|nr:carboxypeptidase-like regulatory domain-containing protein [Streptosporangiaceae bacterium]